VFNSAKGIRQLSVTITLEGTIKAEEDGREKDSGETSDHDLRVETLVLTVSEVS
jgi:hypothetical protein